MLKENINSIYEMIDSLSDEELLEPHMRNWPMKQPKQRYLGNVQVNTC